MNPRICAVARAAAIAVSMLSFGAAQAAEKGDKAAYDQAKTSAKTSYEAAKKQCDPMTGNAKDICVAEAKAVRVKNAETAEATYKNTPKAREHAKHEIAEADYKVAKERCDDMKGNDKDVCVKEAKAAQVKAKADSKADLKVTEAKTDALKDKREANYKVEAEKCDAMTGDPKSACMAAVKTNYGK